MKNYFILLISTLLFFSCAEKLIEEPENLIPENKMVLILKEMAIVNAAKGINVGNLKDNGIDPTMYVFKKFEVDSAQFVDSDRYYASKPLVYESLYKEVEAQLENLKETIEAEKKLKDSLNLLKKTKKVNKAVDSLKIKGAFQ